MLTYEYREIPSITGEVGGDEVYLGTPTGDAGKKLPRAFPSDGSVDAGDSYTAEEIYVDPAGVKYAFVTWNVTATDGTFAGFAIDDLELKFTSSTAAAATATAWYVRLGGGGPPSVTCYGLDRIANRFFRRTPIDSAAPTGAWAGGTVAGVAVAVYEQSIVGKVIPTIPYEIYKMLHGGKLDVELVRRHPIDGPDWGAFDPEQIIRDVARLDREHLERVHRDLTEIASRSRTMLEITERVLRG